MNETKLHLLQASSALTIFTVASVGATQWVASQLGYQHALGPGWGRYAQSEFYAPWSIWRWWFHFGIYAPRLFEHAGLCVAAGAFAAAGVNAALGRLYGAGARASRTYGSARWASLKDIRQAGLTAKHGIILGRVSDAYLRHDGAEHVIAIAPTRSGKGVGLVVPTLLSWTGSVIVHDIKGENWDKSAGWRARFSKCLQFNPTNINSDRYNPLSEVRLGPGEVRDVQNIADILVDPEGALDRRNHWEKTSHSLLVGVILHVLYTEPDKSLSRVAGLLSDPTRPFEHVLEAMLSANHLGSPDQPLTHPVVAAAAREILNKADNERSGVLSTAISFLSLYRDPVVAALTSHCDWRIADLVDPARCMSLYLVIPPSDLSRTRPLIRLILNQIGRRLTEELRPVTVTGRTQLLLVLDEFPALGRLDFFETSLAFLAGYGVRALLVAQSLNQLARAYGENNSILDNCHVRVLFSTNDERTAERIANALGTATEQRAMRNFAGPRASLWLPNISISQQEIGRQLLTPGEVMQLPADDELVLVAGLPPVRAKKLRYYREKAFKRRLSPPPALTGRNDDWPQAPILAQGAMIAPASAMQPVSSTMATTTLGSRTIGSAVAGGMMLKDARSCAAEVDLDQPANWGHSA